MRLFLALAALVLALSTSWAYFGSRPSAAGNGVSLFLPWVMKEARVEEVAIVQRDGHKAVYWPGLTPTLVSVIPIYLEVENRTRRNVTGVTVDFRAFDSSGVLITQTVTQTATLVEVLRPGQRSPVAFNIPFPGGYSAFQAANKSFTLLPDWTYTESDTQAGLEFSATYPGAMTTPTPTRAPLALGVAQTKISHTLEGRSACTTCHTVGGPGVGVPGGTGLPADHAGRTDAVCTSCHQVGVSQSATPTPAPTATPTRTATPTPTAAPTPPGRPPYIVGWAKNTGQWAVSGASAVVTIRGNDKAYNLVLEATKVPIYGAIQPGSWQYFAAVFPRDYGDLYGGYEVVLQGGFQAPGLLGAW